MYIGPSQGSATHSSFAIPEGGQPSTYLPDARWEETRTPHPSPDDKVVPQSPTRRERKKRTGTRMRGCDRGLHVAQSRTETTTPRGGRESHGDYNSQNASEPRRCFKAEMLASAGQAKRERNRVLRSCFRRAAKERDLAMSSLVRRIISTAKPCGHWSLQVQEGWEPKDSGVRGRDPGAGTRGVGGGV